MKKKFMMVAVLLGALTLGACVDDNESQSVTDVRKAKAEQLSALAQKAKAEAEATLISANAEKAYKEALTKYKEALTSQVEEEIRQSKEKFNAELEAIKAEYDKRMWEAKNAALKAEQEFLDKVETRLAALYLAYSEAAEDLSDLKQEKANNEYSLARMQAYALSIDNYIKEKTIEYEAKIKQAETEIAAWKGYSGLDKNELSAELEGLKQDKYESYAAWEAAKSTTATAEKAYDKLVAPYDYETEGVSSVKAVAAVQKYYEMYEDNMWKEPNPYPMASDDDWNAANQKLSTAKRLGLVPDDAWCYGNGSGYIYLNIPCFEIWMDGQYLPCAPIAEERVNLFEDANLSVSYYKVASNLTLDVMTKYYNTFVDNATAYLGVEATATTKATGLYKDLADAQALLAEKKADLTAKEAEVDPFEKAVKDNQALVDAAQAEVDKAKAACDAVSEEIAGYDEEKWTAQRAINAANTEKNVAQTKEATATTDKANATAEKTNAEAAKTQAEADKAAATTDAEKKAAQERIDQAVKDIAAATAAIARADKKLEEAKAAIKAADATIEAEVAKQTAADEKIAAANLKLEDAEEVLATAQRALNNATTELSVAENKLSTVKSAIITLKDEIDAQEKAVAKAQDQIDTTKENIANNEELQAAWNAVVAALTPDYVAEVKALATNKVVTDYIAAIEAEDAAKEAYYEIDSKITAVSAYLTDGNVFDPAEEINKLELSIAGYEKNIEELKNNYSVAGNNADLYEKMIAYTEAEIKELEGKIEIQAEIVELAKKRVEAYIAEQE